MSEARAFRPPEVGLLLHWTGASTGACAGEVKAEACGGAHKAGALRYELLYSFL